MQNIENPENQISLKELGDLLWKSKVLIITVSFFFTVFGLLYSINLNNYYKSDAVLFLSQSSGAPGLTASSAANSSLAAVAGINLSSPVSSQGELALETILSRAFLGRIINRKDVLPSLMAAKEYSFLTNTLTFNEEIYDTKTGKWIREMSAPYQAEPSLLEAYKVYTEDIISVRFDKMQGFFYISVVHISPIFAQEFLSLVIDELNESMRKRDLDLANGYLEYLNEEIGRTNLLEMKSSMNNLLQSQLITKMKAKIGKEYVLRVIEPPYIPEEKSSPYRAIITLMWLISGFVISSLWVMLFSKNGFLFKS